MNFSLNSHDLGKALEVVTAAVSPPRNEHIAQETVPHADLLYYDNHSLSRELKVSERTLQRYRKEGKIRSIVIGGKVYYPKNFLVLPGEDPDFSAPVVLVPKPAQQAWRHKIQQGPPLNRKSRVIDLLSYERQYEGTRLQLLLKRISRDHRIRMHLFPYWPKKVKLTYIPMKKLRDPLFGF